MKEEYYEIIDDEKIEKDNFKSIKELTKYTKILSKGNNLLFVLNNHQEIRMKSSKTLFKISMLIGNLPEENVSFTIYIDQDQEDEQSEEKTSKKDILHSKKKLPISSPSKKEEEKKDKPSSPSSFYLPDDIKESQALEIYKKGNVIGYNHGLFKKIWKNLYIITLLTSSSNFITLLVYSYIIIMEQNYVTLGLDVLSLLTLGLMIFTSASGHMKLISKKKVNFTRENWLLSIFILMGISCIGYGGYLYMYKIKNTLKLAFIYVNGIFGLLIVMSFALICLNIKMMNFYKEYYELTEGNLLVEVE
jgi:hypothetical protein